MQVVVDNEDTKLGRVSGVPLSTFTCWQHGCVDTQSLGKLATFMRRGCFQQGFIDRDLFKYRPDALKDGEDDGDKKDSGPPADDVGPTRFFLISCELALYPGDDGAHCGLPRPSTMLDTATGTLFVSAVSNSTFSLFLEIDALPDPNSPEGQAKPGDADTIRKLGYVQVTYVHVADATRRSTPLGAKRDAVAAALNESAVADFKVPKMARLTRPTNGAVVFSMPFQIRDADTDFNGHLNQSMYVAFVVDTAKGYLRKLEAEDNGKHLAASLRKVSSIAEDEDADEANDYTGVEPSHDATTSKVIRRIRVDYVKEVPGRSGALDVRLTRQGGSQGDENGVVSLWFEVLANTDPEGDASKQFLASQGIVDINSKWLV